jgi:glycosyltransferase involved in cell wall biosynthesis
VDNKKKEWPLISIITPSLNSEEYIEKCILSVFNQSYPNWEHIVVDGGSADNTIPILDKYDHLKYICEPDQGMYDAINKGIRLSKGEMIGYLNSDDMYLPDTFKIAVESFVRWPEVELIYGDCYYIDENGKLLFKYRFPQFDWGFFLMRKGSPISQPTTFWRKSVHNKYGFFDASYKLYGDYDFFMRVCSRKLVRHCGHSMAKFRFHSNRVSKEGGLRERKLIWDKWESVRKENPKNILWDVIKLKLINYRAIVKKRWLRLQGKPC